MLNQLIVDKNRGITYSDLYHFIYTFLGASTGQTEQCDSENEQLEERVY